MVDWRRSNPMRIFNYGRVAEWPIAAVLKTAVGQPTVGSNPTSSDFFFLKKIGRSNTTVCVAWWIRSEAHYDVRTGPKDGTAKPPA
jgi:hypothetical protein